MSSYYCQECGALITDTPRGYVTGCEHWPLEQRKKVHAEPPTPAWPWPEDLDSVIDEDYAHD